MKRPFDIDKDPASIVNGKLYIHYGTDKEQIVGECVDIFQSFEKDLRDKRRK